MKKIFSILLSLALLVSLVVLTTAPVAAVTLPSISPTSATYNLDSPTQLVVGITWGDATSLASIINAGNGTTLNSGTDYILFETIVVFNTTYLNGALTAVGQTLTLQFNFNMPGPYVTDAFLTITATGTNPSVSPASKDWNFYTDGNVTTTIAWGIAASVVSIGDNVGNIGGGNWSVVGSTLTILPGYFTGKWPTAASIGQQVVLNIAFNRGSNATFTVKCVGVAVPSLSPTTVYYNFNLPANVTSTITWGPATAISQVRDITYLITPSVIAAGNWTVSADNTTWILIANPSILYYLNNAPYLSGGRFNYDSYVLGVTYKYLEVTFNDAASTKVTLTLVVAPNLPSVSPTNANWNMNDNANPLYNYVYTVPTFGDSTNVTKVADQTGYTLVAYGVNASARGACNTTSSFDYRVSYNPLIGVYVMSVWKCYLLGLNRTTAMGTAPLTKLGDIAALTISFDKGGALYSPSAYFNITAVGTGGTLSPTTANFNLDAPASVNTTITYGNWAKNVTSIKLGAATLTRDVDYTLVPDGGNATTPSVLTIAASYLSTVLAAVDDSVALTVAFDQGANAVFTITAIGTPSCFIATAAGADAPQLDILREFRDEVLRPNAPWLVSLYYEVSPSIAKVIAGNEALKWLVKEAFVDPITCIVECVMG